jgi:hypothetical protein
MGPRTCPFRCGAKPRGDSTGGLASIRLPQSSVNSAKVGSGYVFRLQALSKRSSPHSAPPLAGQAGPTALSRGRAHGEARGRGADRHIGDAGRLPQGALGQPLRPVQGEVRAASGEPTSDPLQKPPPSGLASQPCCRAGAQTANRNSPSVRVAHVRDVSAVTAPLRNLTYPRITRSIAICRSGLMFEQVCIREITTKLPDESLWAERWQRAGGVWWPISRQRIDGVRIAKPGARRILTVPGARR